MRRSVCRAGPEAALRVRYFEVVAEICNRLKRELGRESINRVASGRVDGPEQANGVIVQADLQGVASRQSEA
jgi:hypothetical protein